MKYLRDRKPTPKSHLLLIPTMSLVDQARLLSDYERAQLGLFDLGILQVTSTAWMELFEAMIQVDGQEPQSVGFAGVSKQPHSQNATLECLYVNRDMRGQRIGNSIVEAMLHKAFTAWGCRRFGTQAYDITESHGIYTRLMKLEGRLRGVGFYNGKAMDLLQYGILREEYFARKQGEAVKLLPVDPPSEK